MSLSSDTSSQLATLDHDIEVLANNMAALHEMARSFPVVVTLPVEKRAVFGAMYDHVAAEIDRLSYALATCEDNALS